MSDNNRSCTNDAMKKILGNMTSEMQNIDGQYVPLGFTPPTTAEPLNWNQPPNACRYNVQNLGPPPMEQYQQPSFDFLPPTQPYFEPTTFKNTPLDYDMYKPMANGPPNLVDYRMLSPNIQQQQQHPVVNISEHLLQNQHEPVPHSANTQLIENLVGNWVVPNNSGTYSPFGNSDSFIPNVFEMQPERDHNNVMNQIIDEVMPPFMTTLDQPLEEQRQFQFNRDTRKPRMVAEVKPMRPSYSDVLTKAVPQTVPSKPLKTDAKEAKPKKDNKKSTKSDKSLKVTISRSNTNNDIKDIASEKTTPQLTKTEKTNKVPKPSQLSRKWASLDNITEPMKTNKVEEVKKKKSDEGSVNSRSFPAKTVTRKLNKTIDVADVDSVQSKNETLNISKNGLKKGNNNNKPNGRPKPNESFGSNERPPGKRNQRTRKRENQVPFGIFGQKLKQYTKGWWKIFTVFILWLFNLISDICSLSLHLSRDMSINLWSWINVHGTQLLGSTMFFMKNLRLLTWIWEKFKGRKRQKAEEETNSFAHNGLQNNINMPTTGDEAMKRLLAGKGKDPYSILGVTPTCTDDDIKRYYKRQAVLVHPDKNQQPGAEEAFKILVHAFDMIGEPERRASYDRGVVESALVVQARSEFTELLQQLQQKVQAAANTIRCSACGLNHKRVKIDRPSYAARNCNSCKIHHAAREGDIWAEARVFGFLWHYYACMEGAVYDITEWAGCQKDSLKHLKPDCHHVQYRIALGKQNNQPRRYTAPPRTDQPDLENILNTLYGQTDSSQGTRRRSKKATK